MSISLSPTPGFCVKSKTLTPVSTKVFVNIAWDKNVPSPPKSSEDDIQRAMHGDDNERGNPWYVPVVVSEPRQDKDKAGNQALVFDCVYNSTLRSRSVRDPDFKSFLVELAIQRIEAQSNLPLSRHIATPNIASKGKLLPRTVNIPSALLKEDPISKKPLIQELPDDDAKPTPKGILKRSSPRPTSLPLEWSWSRLDSGSLNIVFRVPNMTHALIPKTSLDVEPRRIILAIPSHPVLDIDLDISDAEITSRIHNSEIEDKAENTTRTLLLKRQRDFDVDNTKAEWRVAEGVLIVFV